MNEEENAICEVLLLQKSTFASVTEFNQNQVTMKVNEVADTSNDCDFRAQEISVHESTLECLRNNEAKLKAKLLELLYTNTSLELEMDEFKRSVSATELYTLRSLVGTMQLDYARACDEVISTHAALSACEFTVETLRNYSKKLKDAMIELMYKHALLKTQLREKGIEILDTPGI